MAASLGSSARKLDVAECRKKTDVTKAVKGQKVSGIPGQNLMPVGQL